MIAAAEPGHAAINITYDYEIKRQERIVKTRATEGFDTIETPRVAIFYEKQFHVHATEKAAAIAGAPLRVWDIVVIYEDQDDSLVRAMPLLASAGCDRIGTEPGGPETVRLRSADVAVAFVDRAL